MISSNIKRLEGGSTFNPYDFGSSSASTNYGNEPFVTIQTDFAEQNFVQKGGSVMTGSLILEGAAQIIFTDGSNQTRAFDETNVNAISSVIDKTQYINILPNTTTIASDVTISGNVNINSNSFGI